MEMKNINIDEEKLNELLENEYLIRRDELLRIASSARCGWSYISEHLDLPLEFIREFSDKLNWKLLTYNIPYDENFITEFSDLVDWKVLFLKYTFRKDFLYENQDKIRTAIITQTMKGE